MGPPINQASASGRFTTTARPALWWRGSWPGWTDAWAGRRVRWRHRYDPKSHGGAQKELGSIGIIRTPDSTSRSPLRRCSAFRHHMRLVLAAWKKRRNSDAWKPANRGLLGCLVRIKSNRCSHLGHLGETGPSAVLGRWSLVQNHGWQSQMRRWDVKNEISATPPATRHAENPNYGRGTCRSCGFGPWLFFEKQQSIITWSSPSRISHDIPHLTLGPLSLIDGNGPPTIVRLDSNVWRFPIQSAVGWNATVQ